jgi:hypothetical protein
MATKNVIQVKLAQSEELERLYRRFQNKFDSSSSWGRGGKSGWGKINDLQDYFGEVAKNADDYRSQLDALQKSLAATFNEIGIPFPTQISKRIESLSKRLSSVDSVVQKTMDAGTSKLKN